MDEFVVIRLDERFEEVSHRIDAGGVFVENIVKK